MKVREKETQREILQQRVYSPHGHSTKGCARLNTQASIPCEGQVLKY